VGNDRRTLVAVQALIDPRFTTAGPKSTASSALNNVIDLQTIDAVLLILLTEILKAYTFARKTNEGARTYGLQTRSKS
jgi:hypothetical protein